MDARGLRKTPAGALVRAGENLGFNGIDDPAVTVQTVRQDWWNSPEHRPILLDASFSTLGVGAIRGTNTQDVTRCIPAPAGAIRVMYTSLFLAPRVDPPPSPSGARAADDSQVQANDVAAPSIAADQAVNEAQAGGNAPEPVDVEVPEDPGV